MLWVLSDGTEIEAEDYSDSFNIHIPIKKESDVWDMMNNVVLSKDLSTFTLNGEKHVDMVFVGLKLTKDTTVMAIEFSTSIDEELKRLIGENMSLKAQVDVLGDKAEAYEIITGESK